MKPLNFVGSSLDDLRNFPEEARRAAGFELRAVQSGLELSELLILLETYSLISGILRMKPQFFRYVPILWPMSGSSSKPRG